MPQIALLLSLCWCVGAVAVEGNTVIKVRVIAEGGRSVVASLRQSANEDDFISWTRHLQSRLGTVHVAAVLDADLAQVLVFIRIPRGFVVGYIRPHQVQRDSHWLSARLFLRQNLKMAPCSTRGHLAE